VSLETAAVGPWASRALSYNGHPIPRKLPQRCFQTERPAYRQDQRVRVHDMTRASNQPGSQGKAGKRHTGGCQPESWGKDTCTVRCMLCTSLHTSMHVLQTALPGCVRHCLEVGMWKGDDGLKWSTSMTASSVAKAQTIDKDHPICNLACSYLAHTHVLSRLLSTRKARPLPSLANALVDY